MISLSTAQVGIVVAVVTLSTPFDSVGAITIRSEQNQTPAEATESMSRPVSAALQKAPSAANSTFGLTRKCKAPVIPTSTVLVPWYSTTCDMRKYVRDRNGLRSCFETFLYWRLVSLRCDNSDECDLRQTTAAIWS